MAVQSTPVQGLPYPDNNEYIRTTPSHIEALARAIETRAVMRFDSITSRDTALTAPVDGMVAWTSAERKLWVRDTTWKQLYPPVPVITSGTAAPSGAGTAGDLYFQYTA